jgi:hypothetical protein
VARREQKWSCRLRQIHLSASNLAAEPVLACLDKPSGSLFEILNPNTTWVAVGLVSSVIFAALTVALHPKPDDLTEKPRQTRADLNTNPAALSSVAGSDGKSTGEITSGKATNVDPGSTTDANHLDAPANATSWSPAHRQDSARVIRSKIPNAGHRSSVRPRIVDVKMRLIALWRQSLARPEKSRTWTPFSNSDGGRKKKVSHTTETRN